MKSIIVLFIIFSTVFLYAGNIYKLTQCDFKSDYKCEILHWIGIFPPLSLFTYWIWTDK